MDITRVHDKPPNPLGVSKMLDLKERAGDGRLDAIETLGGRY